MAKIEKKKNDDEAALLYHSTPSPGKFTIKTIKPMNNSKDLSLAYSPGVATPCMEIFRNPEAAY